MCVFALIFVCRTNAHNHTHSHIGPSSFGKCTCKHARVHTHAQVFTFIIMDITINNFVEIFLPSIIALIFPCCAATAAETPGEDDDDDDKGKPEFELSDEYFEITYRQFIMYFGLTVFPMITAITLLCNIFEVLVDRYRLIRCCNRPKGMVPGGRKLIFNQLLGAAICGLVAFPCGAVYFGPGFLCWPCPQYSAATILDPSSSLQEYQTLGSLKTQPCNNVAAFEQPMCKLDNGKDVSVAEIRMHVDRLKGWDAFTGQELEKTAKYMDLYKASQDWMAQNFMKLESSNRCACSPCVNVKSCNCGDRALEGLCRLENRKHCMDPKTGEVQRRGQLANARQDNSTQSIYCQEDGNCLDPKFPKCADNRNFDMYQCDKKIYQYTSKPTSTAKCKIRFGSPEKEGSPCDSHAKCGQGICEGGENFQCPNPEQNDATTAANMCWLCPETKLGGLVNPRNAKSWWTLLDRPSQQKDGGFNLCRSCFSPFGDVGCTQMGNSRVTMFGVTKTV